MKRNFYLPLFLHMVSSSIIADIDIPQIFQLRLGCLYVQQLSYTWLLITFQGDRAVVPKPVSTGDLLNYGPFAMGPLQNYNPKHCRGQQVFNEYFMAPLAGFHSSSLRTTQRMCLSSSSKMKLHSSLLPNTSYKVSTSDSWYSQGGQKQPQRS